MAVFVRSSRFGIEKVIRFNLACAEYLDAHCVSYEEMRADPVEPLVDMIAYLGQERSRETVTAVVERNEFVKMRNREAAGEYDTNQLTPRDPNDPNSFKVRKGKVGGWCDEMDDETQEFSNKLLKSYRYFQHPKLLERPRWA